MKRKAFVLSIIVFLLALTGNFDQALAGCGCEHPPPPPAPVIPSVIYPGMPVNLYSGNFILGGVYTVRFGGVSVTGTADIDREGEMRVRVTLPDVPSGPTQIEVTDGSGTVLSISSSEFTVVSSPYVLPGEGEFKYRHQTLAVGADGVLYVPLDMSNVIDAVDIKGELMGYPLRIDDFTVLNVQGYNMETVGLERIKAVGGRNKSEMVFYSRHAFEAYYEDHSERGAHQVDPYDPDYHLDGTPHIDHNHLILAISGHFDDGTRPVPGTTSDIDVKLNLSE